MTQCRLAHSTIPNRQHKSDDESPRCPVNLPKETRLCRSRIGGRAPPMHTRKPWPQQTSPGSSCAATRIIAQHLRRPQLKPITGQMALLGAGGCDFLADPTRRADDTPVFWRVDQLASVIVLAPTATIGAPPLITLADLPPDMIRRDAEDGAHVIVRSNVINHQLLVIGALSDVAPLAAIIPLDVTAPQRTDAALRFLRFIAHRMRRTPPSPLRRRERLIAALRALDASLSGASYRDIADGLFDPSRIPAEPWKTASLRDTVIRLVRTGFAMMRGDYRHLLGPRRGE